MGIPENINTAKIRGEKTLLNGITGEDAQTVADWKNEDEVFRFALSTDKPVTVESQRADIARTLRADEPYFLIRALETRKPIGYVRFDILDNERSKLLLRYALGEPEYRGKGFAFDALHAVLKHFFGNGALRVEAECYDFNEPGLKLLKKLGFSIEGRKRKAGYYYSTCMHFDVLVLGLLGEEFN